MTTAWQIIETIGTLTPAASACCMAYCWLARQLKPMRAA
jgi:hypothetical protein